MGIARVMLLVVVWVLRARLLASMLQRRRALPPRWWRNQSCTADTAELSVLLAKRAQRYHRHVLHWLLGGVLLSCAVQWVLAPHRRH